MENNPPKSAALVVYRINLLKIGIAKFELV